MSARHQLCRPVALPGNPEGWQTVAGGRSAVETSGRHLPMIPHPEGVAGRGVVFCHPCGVDDFVAGRSGGVAALNPRLLSGTPPASECVAELLKLDEETENLLREVVKR